MALTATIHRIELALSDVDRGVYESLDLRMARHPSESTRYMLTRLFAYALSYEEGISFSKGGLSSTDEPPVAVHDPTGLLLAWIDVGSPSAERLHKAAKAARRVALYTHIDMAWLRREIGKKEIHRADDIEVWRLESAFLDGLEPDLERHAKWELVRNEGQLYVTTGNSTRGTSTREGTITRVPLLER